MKPSWRIVLEALESGQTVKLVYHDWVMVPGHALPSENTDNIDPNRKLMFIKGRNVNTGQPVFMNPYLTINDFLIFCERLDKEYLMELSANTALTNINRSKAGSRRDATS